MKTKICTKCGKEKDLSKFYKEKLGKDGFRGDCKDCYKKRKKVYYDDNQELMAKQSKTSRTKNKEKLLKTRKEKNKKYPWKRILSYIKQRCNNFKVENYKYYGLKGIKCLITEEEIQFLWFRDKAYLMKQPSIDRKNISKNYTFRNCQFIEMDINRVKDRYKTVLQFDLKGNFIREFKSIIEASKILNISRGNISQCCLKNPNYNHVGNFKWEYKNEN